MVFTQNETKFRRVVPLILIPSHLKECVSLNRSVELLGLWGGGNKRGSFHIKRKQCLVLRFCYLQLLYRKCRHF